MPATLGLETGHVSSQRNTRAAFDGLATSAPASPHHHTLDHCMRRTERTGSEDDPVPERRLVTRRAHPLPDPD